MGVTVVMNGNSKTATVTDIDGRYSVNVGPKQKADYLSFSYVGMKPANVKIGGKSVIDVTLQDDNTNLADVIVVGYGTQGVAHRSRGCHEGRRAAQGSVDQRVELARR